MTVPTRIIERDTFEALLAQEEGNMIIRFQLEAYEFTPPRPDEPFDDTNHMIEHVHILFLNTAEPVIYRDRQANDVLVIMPKYADHTYADWSDVHPNSTAWCYVVAPHGWDARDWQDELDIPEYYFSEEPLPKYDKEKVGTH